MASPSVSFRISRSAEDLAETIHALSQRLVKLEQRFAAMEMQLAQQQRVEPEEEVSLENVERLLQDCRDLLEVSAETDSWPEAGPVAGEEEAATGRESLRGHGFADAA